MDAYDVGGLPSIRRQVSPTLGAGIEDMMEGFEKEEAKATALFKQYDADSSGTLETAELKTLLDTLELPLEEEQYQKYVQAMFKSCDADGSGRIEFREFMKLFRKIFVDKVRQANHSKKMQNQFMNDALIQEQRELFFRYDEDNSGEIELGEFRKALESEGKLKVDDDHWEDVIAELKVDEDHDGKITFDEWLHFARKFLGEKNQSGKKLQKKVKHELSKVQEAEAWEKFYQYDVDGSGHLDTCELRQLLAEVQLEFTDEQWEHLFKDILNKAEESGKGEKQDGKLDFQEFLYFYKKCLRGEKARKSWKEKLDIRHAKAETNFLQGFDS